MSIPSHHDARDIGVPLSSGGDRRRACRYSVALPECSLAWKKDSCLVEKACQVVDISMAGCLVESASVPTRMEKQAVWLRIPDLSPGDWTEGVVVSAWKPWFRKSRIRIKFVSPLPYDTFGRLVFGQDYLCQFVDRELPEHDRDHFWR
jgi:hypothetical protein